jgi:hypothetical protein
MYFFHLFLVACGKNIFFLYCICKALLYFSPPSCDMIPNRVVCSVSVLVLEVGWVATTSLGTVKKSKFDIV